MSAQMTGPEYGALEDTRRWLVVVASGIVTTFAAIAVAAQWARLAPPEHAIMITAAVLVVVGTALSRRPTGLWLVVAGLLCTACGALLAQGSPPWIPLTVVSAYAVYFSILLLPRTVSLAVPVVGAVFLALVWSARPGNVVAGPLGVLGGWVAVAQTILSGYAIWLAWRLLSDEAQSADAVLATLEERTAASLALQERARAWRATATQVHESLLNTIRYVLSAPTPDRTRLSAEVQLDVAAADADLPEAPTLAALVSAIRSSAQVEELEVGEPVPEVALEPAVFECVRAAAVELVRNAARHAGARHITLTVAAGGGGDVTLVVTDDGAGIPEGARPGVGQQQVLTASLREVGGDVTFRSGTVGGTVATVTAPRVRGGQDRRAVPRAYPPFDKGRLLVTAPMAGICVAGVAYFLLLGSSAVGPQYVSVVAGLVAIAVAVTVVIRRRRLGMWPALPLILIPALVPWFLLADDFTCGRAAVLSPVVNISGYCILILTAWSRWLPGLIGLSLWGASSIHLLTQLPSACRSSTLLAVTNSLIALPLILVVASAGARAYQRAQDRGQLTRQREIMERSRALAAVDINTQLEDAVNDAVVVLDEVVAGEPLDGERRHRLEQADGRIRAGIQVDPQSTGAVATLAKATVDEVSGLGVAVNVRSLVSSADQHALPLTAQHLVYRLLAVPSTPHPVIQAFTDGEEDHLSMVVCHEALRYAGVRPGDTLRLDDVVVEVDDEPVSGEGTEEFAVLISRPVRDSR